jgi:hypothetical protein
VCVLLRSLPAAQRATRYAAAARRRRGCYAATLLLAAGGCDALQWPCVCVFANTKHKCLSQACVLRASSPGSRPCVHPAFLPGPLLSDTGWLERSDLSTATVPYGRGCCVEKLWVTFPAGILDC